jgi:hypothetical protein
MQAFGQDQIADAHELNECRMSNKVYPPSAAPEATREFRMMKFNDSLFSFGVLHSLFDLPAMPWSEFGTAPSGLWVLCGYHRTSRRSAWQAGILRFAFELLSKFR